MKNGFDQYYDEAMEPGKRERAYAWATAIGLQDVDGLKPSPSKLHRRQEKLDIGDGKLDIERKKLDIADLSAPTQANIKKLREAFAAAEFFKRADALKVLDLTPTAVSNLLSRMNQLGLIAPMSGHGKGAWRFEGSDQQGARQNNAKTRK